MDCVGWVNTDRPTEPLKRRDMAKDSALEEVEKERGLFSGPNLNGTGARQAIRVSTVNWVLGKMRQQCRLWTPCSTQGDSPATAPVTDAKQDLVFLYPPIFQQESRFAVWCG